MSHTCDRHRRAQEHRQHGPFCDECDIEREQADRDQRNEDRERRRLRDRMALQFAVTMLHTDGYDTPVADVAQWSYQAADAMLAERDSGER